MENTLPVSKEAADAVQRVLRERLGSLGFREAKVYAGHDHDGDPVLYVDAFYDLKSEPIDVGATFGLTRLLRHALEALGETRFPHLRHHFDERQQVAAPS